MSFEALLTAAGGIISSNSANRLSATSIPGRHAVSLTLDLCLVASNVRAGFLLDTFAPLNPPELFFPLLRSLRQVLPEFRRVLLLHDENSNQTFFINTTLLRKSCEGAYNLGDGKTGDEMQLTSDGWIDCVSLETPPVLMTRQPKLRHIWDHIIGNVILNPPTAVIQIPSDLTSGREHLLIPLAAFLLEYPVGYVPLGTNQTAFLSNVPLDVYECVLEDSGEEHTLLKFSCPQCVSQSAARLTPDKIQRRLVDRFQPRLQAVDYPRKLKVRHTQETLARVGL